MLFYFVLFLGFGFCCLFLLVFVWGLVGWFGGFGGEERVLWVCLLSFLLKKPLVSSRTLCVITRLSGAGSKTTLIIIRFLPLAAF